MISEIHEHFRAAMVRAQGHQAGNADEKRLPAPHFLPGDRVLLSAKNITACQPSQKLDHSRLRQFEVVAGARLRT